MRRSLARKFESQFIVAAYQASAMTKNRAFDGWVLELDVLFHIRKNLMTDKIKVLGTGRQFLDSDGSFQCSEAIEFVEPFAISEERTTYPYCAVTAMRRRWPI